MSGTEQAAVMLLVLGEPLAARVLRYMTPVEANRLARAALALDGLDSSRVAGVVGEFLEFASVSSALGVGCVDYLRKTFRRAFGKERAGLVLDRLAVAEEQQAIERLQWMDAREIADLLHHEHPQIVAVLLTRLPGRHAAEVLKWLPADKRADLLIRVGRLSRVRRRALETLDAVLEEQCAVSTECQSFPLGGVQQAAAILEESDDTCREWLVDHLGEADESLARDLQQARLGFRLLLEMSAGDCQALFRAVSPDVMALALSGVTPALREQILGRLSRRTADLLQARLDVMNTPAPREVRQAQAEILGLARRIMDAG